MSVEVLQVLTLVFFIISALLAVFAIILFFTLNIPKVLGDLSGVTARKAIEDIQRKSGEDSAQWSGYTSGTKGGLSDKENASGRLRKVTDKLTKGSASASSGRLALPFSITDKLGERGSDETTLLASQGSNETTVLGTNYSNETTLLAQNAAPETTLLAQNAAPETTLLMQNTVPEFIVRSADECSSFTVDVDISFYDSTEIID